MKNLQVGLIVFFIFAYDVSAAPERNIVVLDTARPDFYIQSIFSAKAQRQVIYQLRQAMKNAMGIDPLSHEFSETLHFESKLDPKIPSPIKDMVEGLIKMKFDAADLLVDIDGLKIESPAATVELKNMEMRESGLQLVASLRLKQTKASARKITIRFRPNNKSSTFVQKLYVELLNPMVSAEKLDSLAADVIIRTETLVDGSTRIGLDGSVMTLFDRVNGDQLANELAFDPGEIRVPEGFGIQVGGVWMPLKKDGLRAAVNRRKADIADLMFTPLARKIRQVPLNFFGSTAPSLILPKVIHANVPCFGDVGIQLLRYGKIGKDQIQLAFGLTHPTYPKSREGFGYFDSATDSVYSEIDSTDSSIVMGVGYRAMSWAMNNILTGCMKDKLPPDLELGPKGVIVRLDEVGNGAGIFAMHAQSRAKKFVGFILGSPLIEFPIKLAPCLEFKPGDQQETTLRLDLGDADISEDILLNGYRSIPSNLSKLRLTKFVMKKVRAQLQSGLRDVKMDIPLGFAKGDDLKFAEIKADGFGNLNLSLQLDPEIDGEARDFWTIFSELLKPMFLKTNRQPEPPTLSNTNTSPF